MLGGNNIFQKYKLFFMQKIVQSVISSVNAEFTCVCHFSDNFQQLPAKQGSIPSKYEAFFVICIPF